MNFRIFQALALASLLLSASSSIAMQVDLSTPTKTKAVLEQTLTISTVNLTILDRLLSDKKGEEIYTDRAALLRDTQKLEENAKQLERIATAIEVCDKTQWAIELQNLSSDFEAFMELQNELIGSL